MQRKKYRCIGPRIYTFLWYSVCDRQMVRGQIRRQSSGRPAVRTEKHGVRHLDGQLLPQSFGFGLCGFLCHLAESFQQLATVAARPQTSKVKFSVLFIKQLYRILHNVGMVESQLGQCVNRKPLCLGGIVLACHRDRLINDSQIGHCDGSTSGVSGIGRYRP